MYSVAVWIWFCSKVYFFVPYPKDIERRESASSIDSLIDPILISGLYSWMRLF